MNQPDSLTLAAPRGHPRLLDNLGELPVLGSVLVAGPFGHQVLVPMFTCVSAPRSSEEIDRKAPLGTDVESKVCLVAKRLKTEGDHT